MALAYLETGAGACVESIERTWARFQNRRTRTVEKETLKATALAAWNLGEEEPAAAGALDLDGANLIAGLDTHTLLGEVSFRETPFADTNS